VLVAIAVIVIVKATGGSSTSSTGDAAGRNPPLASSAVLAPLASVSSSVFNSVGTAGMVAPLTVTAKQPLLTSGGHARFVYVGAEYCPYCGMERWALVTALDRFGTFTGIKQIDSSSTDSAAANIPTLSFLRASYTSKYLVFTPYEEEDRNEQPLVTVPSDVQSIFTTYDANSQGNGTVFDGGNGGIPFIDVANKYVSAGTPEAFSPVETALEGNGLTHVQIAQAVADPTSAIGTAMGAKYLVAEANYLSAAICNVNGNAPSSVCQSVGVKDAKAVLAASKPVS
jgi:hypothetical protein